MPRGFWSNSIDLECGVQTPHVKSNDRINCRNYYNTFFFEAFDKGMSQ